MNTKISKLDIKCKHEWEFWKRTSGKQYKVCRKCGTIIPKEKVIK